MCRTAAMLSALNESLLHRENALSPASIAWCDGFSGKQADQQPSCQDGAVRMFHRIAMCKRLRIL